MHKILYNKENKGVDRMSEYIKERDLQRKREYHREWRKKHPESVKAAQMRYWAKKAAEMKISASDSEAETTEIE